MSDDQLRKAWAFVIDCPAGKKQGGGQGKGSSKTLEAQAELRLLPESIFFFFFRCLALLMCAAQNATRHAYNHFFFTSKGHMGIAVKTNE